MEGVEQANVTLPSADAPTGAAQSAQVDNALRALNNKKPIPEIDFTLHTMEDGIQVNTTERVVKGMDCLFIPTHLTVPLDSISVVNDLISGLHLFL